MSERDTLKAAEAMRSGPGWFAVALAIHLDPSFVDAYRGLGAALLDRHEYAGTVEALEAATQLRGDDAEAAYWLGLARMTQRDFSGAASARPSRLASWRFRHEPCLEHAGPVANQPGYPLLGVPIASCCNGPMQRVYPSTPPTPAGRVAGEFPDTVKHCFTVSLSW